MRRLQCFAYGNDDGFEAICIDLDISVQGKSFDEVYELLRGAVETYIQDAMKEDEATARRLLSRRAPWHVRVGYRLRHIWHTLSAKRLASGRSDGSFDVACPA